MPVFVERNVLEDSVAAQSEQRVLLQLEMFGMRLHGRQRQIDDLLEKRGMDFRSDVPGEFVETSAACGLYLGYMRVCFDAGNDYLSIWKKNIQSCTASWSLATYLYYIVPHFLAEISRQQAE